MICNYLWSRVGISYLLSFPASFFSDRPPACYDLPGQENSLLHPAQGGAAGAWVFSTREPKTERSFSEFPDLQAGHSGFKGSSLDLNRISNTFPQSPHLNSNIGILSYLKLTLGGPQK